VCGLDILGGNPRPAAGLETQAGPASGHQPATGDAQVERLVEPGCVVLGQHILAGDAQIGGAVFDIGGHVAGADDEKLQPGAIGRQDQLAALAGIDGGFDADAGQEGDGFVVDAALG
jgi:hypothetical protein